MEGFGLVPASVVQVITTCHDAGVGIGKGGNAMPEQNSDIEKRGKEALEKYNPEAKDINVIEVISIFTGRALVLVEFKYNKDDDAEEWGVLVGSENCTVFPDRSVLLRLAAEYKPNWLQQISSSQSILFLLTVIIVAASIVAFFMSPAHEVGQPLNAALSSVLGFWLGRAVPQVR
jgi:hypothetical protein